MPAVSIPPMNAGVAALVAALAVGPLTLPSLAEAQAGERPERLRPALSVVEPVALAIVQDRIYRAGVFLIVDALVENRSLRNVERAQVAVELDNFFDELVRMEPAALSPATLAPGQVAALRAVTPYSETARKIRYRFTWWQDGEQFQAVEKRDIWMTGSPARAPGERLVGP
jgi:hypothetical protein